MSKVPQIALAGNPNCGKSTLFNALTGLRQKVGNYPGVTVDRKSGSLTLRGRGRIRLIDLPGTYSLYPRAQDESVASTVLLQEDHPDHPELVVVVVDATNLRRGLLLATQVADLGLPGVLALNMADLVQKAGLRIDIQKLSEELGMPVYSVSAREGIGLDAFRAALEEKPEPAGKPFFHIPSSFDAVIEKVKKLTGTDNRYRAWQMLLHPEGYHWMDQDALKALREESGITDPDGLISNELTLRYERIREILAEVVKEKPKLKERLTERLDRILLHKVGGYVIFVGLLFLIFQAIFAWAGVPMEWIDAGFSAAGDWLGEVLPESFLTSLLIDGVWAGLGGIVIFVPQIAFLFFFISILEETGYMSRVVFLMDRIVRPFGFSGKSVIPLIGGMACAVPSIMMARTISNRVERLITIMVTPLMSCSARIPVYVLLISLFVPEETVLGIFNLQGIVMTGMYFLGFFMALFVAWVIKKIARYRSDGLFVAELPIYRAPRWNNTLLTMYHKSRTFVVEAGKVIMVISVILWLLSSFGPGDAFEKIEADYSSRIEAVEGNSALVAELENERASAKLKSSYAGWLGQAIEPAIRPLGFDWKIGISLITSFAAREVFVGTMATLYSAGSEAAEDEDGKFAGLRSQMQEEKFEDTGELVYSRATAISLLLFYAFAMQCMSTLAVVRKETRSWGMTFIMLGYLTALAYLSSLAAYQLLA
jgi:ferrous iron transport protein B